MINNHDYPRVVFPEYYDETTQEDIESKGWMINVLVVIGLYKYSIEFRIPNDLERELDIEHSMGRTRSLANPYLIVIDRVSKNRIIESVIKHWEQGYFSKIAPNA